MLKYEVIEKTLDSKKEAIKKMYDMFPGSRIEQTADSFNDENFSAFYVHCPIEKFAKKASKVYVARAELFDMGNPKLIGKKNFIYCSSFFNVHFLMYIPYQSNDREKTISVYWHDQMGLSWGLKNWKNNIEYIRGILDENPNTELIEHYKKHVNDADDEFDRWKKEIK